MDSQTVIRETKNWVLQVVIGLNLCPFAKKEFDQDKIRFSTYEGQTDEGLMDMLQTELELLQSDSTIETTLLIHPYVLSDFYTYYGFLDKVEHYLLDSDLNIDFQVASFHPEYQFEDTNIDDVENYTNRSPYPMLHLLREHSLDRAIDLHSDTSKIPERNQRLLREMGKGAIKDLLQKCLLS